MKNFLSAVIIVLVVAFLANCSAEYRDCYKNDSNYTLVRSGHGAHEYLYLPSVEVQEYNPPHYQIAGIVVIMYDRDQKDDISHELVRYNWYTKETFHQDEEGNWQKDKIENHVEWYARKSVVNALFKAVYGMNFYSD